MPIEIRPLTGQELLVEEGPIINANLRALAEAFNRLEGYLNPLTGKLVDIDEIIIGTGTVASRVRLQVYGDVATQGNMTVAKTLSAANAIITQTLEVKSGTLTLSGTNSQIEVEGNLHVGGEVVHTEMSENFISAESTVFFSQGTSQLVTDGSSNVIGGLYIPNGRSIVVLDWSGYDSVDTTKNLDTVYLGSTNILPGHEIKIISKLGTNLSHDFIVKNENDDPFFTDTGVEYTQIVFGETDQVAALIYDGTKWTVLYTRGATFAV